MHGPQAAGGKTGAVIFLPGPRRGRDPRRGHARWVRRILLQDRRRRAHPGRDPRGGDGMTDLSASVAVVDDDDLVLRALDRLLRSAGFTVQTFSSPRDYLARRA